MAATARPCSRRVGSLQLVSETSSGVLRHVLMHALLMLHVRVTANVDSCACVQEMATFFASLACDGRCSVALMCGVHALRARSDAGAHVERSRSTRAPSSTPPRVAELDLSVFEARVDHVVDSVGVSGGHSGSGGRCGDGRGSWGKVPRSLGGGKFYFGFGPFIGATSPCHQSL